MRALKIMSILIEQHNCSKVNLPTISASRDIGTATSVDQISVPSGLTASMAQRDCFLADQRLSPSSRDFANTNSLPLLLVKMDFVRWMLSSIAVRDPVNLDCQLTIMF